uniref:Uncharacterized protein n=1 Tax=Amphimedon queenslandica TaxID=400682 RepID=A0A1X7V509_AMPQE
HCHEIRDKQKPICFIVTKSVTSKNPLVPLS